MFTPYSIPTKGKSCNQNFTLGYGSSKLSLSVRLQISFLCRLIKLVWHISDFYHLISAPFVHRADLFSLRSFLLFCISFFLSLRWFPLLSIAFPSFVSFHFTVFFLRCIYHRTCRCCSSVCLHSTRLKPRPVLVQRSRGNEHPFWDSHGFRQGYFTPSTTNGMNSNSFRVSVSLCGRCFKEEDRSPREGQDCGR